MPLESPFKDELYRTATYIVADGKGLLAADESTGSIAKRLDGVGKENTDENRRQWRDLLFNAGSGEIGKYIGGIITFEETLMKHQDSKGKALVEVISSQKIIPGIKTDKGVKPLEGSPEETTTQGLDDLDKRCDEYYKRGARFAKWRCTYSISETTPSALACLQNAEVLARYASISQAHGLVPIVEPEVLLDGKHTIEQSYEAHIRVLSDVFAALNRHRVDLRGILLKPSMVLSGPDSKSGKASPQDVAKYTCAALSATVPALVPGCVFLSGGQGDVEAIENLNAINVLKQKEPQSNPWKLSFSYGRGLQREAMQLWAKGDYEGAQKKYVDVARQCHEAALGKYQGK